MKIDKQRVRRTLHKWCKYGLVIMVVNYLHHTAWDVYHHFVTHLGFLPSPASIASLFEHGGIPSLGFAIVLFAMIVKFLESLD